MSLNYNLMSSDLDAALARAEALQEHVTDWHDRALAAEARAEAAEKIAETRLADLSLTIEWYNARISKQEEALLPFALEADVWAETTADDYKPRYAGNHMNPRAKFSVGDLRRARKCVPRTSL